MSGPQLQVRCPKCLALTKSRFYKGLELYYTCEDGHEFSAYEIPMKSWPTATFGKEQPVKQDLKTLPKGIEPTFHPMPGKIAVKLIAEEVVGGLWLPTTAAQRVMGQIVAIGDDEADGDDYPLAVGEVVLFGVNSGITVRVEREEVRILRTTEILCKVTWDEKGT